jgi:hypothetical protein
MIVNNLIIENCKYLNPLDESQWIESFDEMVIDKRVNNNTVHNCWKSLDI